MQPWRDHAATACSDVNLGVPGGTPIYVKGMNANLCLGCAPHIQSGLLTCPLFLFLSLLTVCDACNMLTDLFLLLALECVNKWH